MKDGRNLDFHGIDVMACDATGKLTRVPERAGGLCEAVRALFDAMAAGFASLTLTPTKIYATGPHDAAFAWVGQGVMKDPWH